MLEKLINLIKESNFIVIYGQFGSGKKLLLSKLFHDLPKKENELEKENIFLDNYTYHLEKPRDKRIFLILDEKREKENFEKVVEKASETADLIIETCRVDAKTKELNLRVVRCNEWNLTIPTTPLDFTRLEEWEEKKLLKNWTDKAQENLFRYKL